jgi:hypothetical protein
MPNGDNLPDDFWQKLDERIEKLSHKIDDCNRSIAGLTAYGCAQRPNDVRRIEELEGWRTKGIIGVITTFAMSIGALIGMLLSGHNK